MTSLKRKSLLLIAGSNADWLHTLQEVLAGDYIVHLATRLEEALRSLRDTEIDAVLADSESASYAIEFCELIRGATRGRGIPIIFLTESTNPEAASRAIQCGADDVIPKPCSAIEILVRMKGKLRIIDELRSEKHLSLGGVILDQDRYALCANGRSIGLTVLQFNLLRYFMENFDRMLTREEILQHVWRDVAVKPRVIDTHINLLRKKLGFSGLTVVTKYGLGYSLRTRQETKKSENRPAMFR